MPNKQLRLNRHTFAEYIKGAEVGKVYAVQVLGNSMYPFLVNKKSVVYMEKPDLSKYKAQKGDIVFFKRADGRFVLHRIYKVKKDGTLIINGDAQNWFETTTVDSICGVVKSITRKKRTFSVKNPIYLLCVFLWRCLLPVRQPILKLKSKIKR